MCATQWPVWDLSHGPFLSSVLKGYGTLLRAWSPYAQLGVRPGSHKQLMGSLSWAPPCFLHSLPGTLFPWGSLLGFPAIYLGLYLSPLLTCTSHNYCSCVGAICWDDGEREKGAGVHPHTWDHYSSDRRGCFPSLRVLGVRGPPLPLSGHPFLTPQAWNRGFLLEFQLYWCLLLGFQLPWVRLADTRGE